MTMETLCAALRVINSQALEVCVPQERDRLRTLVIADFDNRCESFDQLLALKTEDTQLELEQLHLVSQQYVGVAEWTGPVVSRYGGAIEQLTAFLRTKCGRLEPLLQTLRGKTIDASVTSDLIDTIEVLT